MNRQTTLCLTGSESALSAAGVKDFIDMLGVAYLTERASLSSNLVQQSSFVHEVYILNDATHSAVEDFHDMYWLVIPDIHS